MKVLLQHGIHVSKKKKLYLVFNTAVFSVHSWSKLLASSADSKFIPSTVEQDYLLTNLHQGWQTVGVLLSPGSLYCASFQWHGSDHLQSKNKTIWSTTRTDVSCLGGGTEGLACHNAKSWKGRGEKLSQDSCLPMWWPIAILRVPLSESWTDFLVSLIYRVLQN